MKKAAIVSIVTATLMIFGGVGLSEERVSFKVGADVGYLSGYTLFYIIYIPAGPEDYPFTSAESELEYPLDSVIAGLNASLGMRNIWLLDLSLSKNLTRDTGKTKDSDFLTVGYGYVWKTGNKREKLIYSESDTDMDVSLLDLNGRYYFLRRMAVSLGLIGGYRYQYLSFDISNVNQWSPLYHSLGLSDPYEAYVPGKVSTYKITYRIPYAGLTLDLRPSTMFSLNLRGALGQASAKDEGDWILRKKQLNAEAEGPFYLFGAKGNLSLSRRLSLQMAIEYLKIDTDGTQDQTWYETTEEAVAGAIITGIDYKAESEQLYLWGGVRYIF